jgi:hypothetical protein
VLSAAASMRAEKWTALSQSLPPGMLRMSKNLTPTRQGGSAFGKNCPSWSTPSANPWGVSTFGDNSALLIANTRPLSR